MSRYQQFQFVDYQFDATTKTLALTYGYDDSLNFTERYVFDFAFIDYDQAQLDRAIQNLFLMAGVSYYKAYLAPTVALKAIALDQTTADFLNHTYQQGLGEFFYVNQLDPRTNIGFTANAAEQSAITAPVTEGLLIGLGGGKDSLLSLELLRNQPRVATWSLGHHEQLAPLIAETGVPHLQVSRHFDRSLLEHNQQSAYNGHVPISAILACVGTIVGILAGYNQAVVSNENSANEPTLVYQGVAINHQYSKSLAFETDYQQLLQHSFGSSLNYFSLLRPLSELRIAELFVDKAFSKYRAVFSSCNRAFTMTSHALSWCGECPKCAFVYLMLAPFVDETTLTSLWGGKNLLHDPQLVPTYKQLLGIEGDKPLECVGEVKESRAAMRLLQQHDPDLRSYEFELPDDYDWRALAAHSMPGDLFALIQS